VALRQSATLRWPSWVSGHDLDWWKRFKRKAY
jgi:hypothetical protein